MRPDERSTGQILAQALDQTRELFRTEIELAKAETRIQVTRAAIGGALGAGGLLFGVFGLLFLLWAAVWALAPELPMWLASLAVGAGALLAAAILATLAINRFKKINPRPERAVRQLKETVEWAKKEKRA